MGALLSYSLAVSVVILLLFPILWQIVNRCTSFRFNRASIIGGMVLSLVIPCVVNPETFNILSVMKSGPNSKSFYN